MLLFWAGVTVGCFLGVVIMSALFVAKSGDDLAEVDLVPLCVASGRCEGK